VAFPDRWHLIITEAVRCRPQLLALPESLDQPEPRREEAVAFMETALVAARALIA